MSMPQRVELVPSQVDDLDNTNGRAATVAVDVDERTRPPDVVKCERDPRDEEGDVAKRAEEEEEANLVLTETFTLGAEECIVSESEDDHSDDKLPAVSTDANGTVGGEQGQETFDNDQEQTANATGPSVLTANEMEASPTPSTRRPQSPTTQAVENQFRKVIHGLASSIDVASATLQDSLGEVLQRLVIDLGDRDGETVEKLQVVQEEFSKQICSWLTRQQDAGFDEASIDTIELRLGKTNEHSRTVVARAFQDRCAVAEKRVKDMIDEVTDSFNRYLESATAASKQHFRWIKRRYREKIDVNRVASKIELRDTMLLDRCMLEETTRDMDLRHKEEVERLRVEFQLERSELRQKRREVEQSVEVLQLEKLQAEQDAAQAHRYIETLEEEAEAARAGNHSEEGSTRSHKQSRTKNGMSPRGAGTHSPRTGSRGASPRNAAIGGGSGQGSRHASKTRLSFGARTSDSSNGGSGTHRQNDYTASGAGGGGNTAGGGRHALAASGGGLSARGSARGLGSARQHGRGGRGSILFQDLPSARGADPGETRRSPRGGESGQDTGRQASSRRSTRKGQQNNPAARHEEARQKFEQDVAYKLMSVIDKKKISDLQEALADEAMNREAAQARLRMMEQAIPTLHEDLMKAQEQLVQARMETNELRKINTVMTADMQQRNQYQKRGEEDARHASALALLDELTGEGVGRGGNIKRGLGSPVEAGKSGIGAGKAGDLKTGRHQLDVAGIRKAKELRQWIVQSPTQDQQSGDDEDSQVESVEEMATGDHRGVIADLNKQIKNLEEERDIAVSETTQHREGIKEKDQALDREEEKLVSSRPISPRTLAVVRLELAALKDTRRDLESKIANMQVAVDENGYLRRRLEAIERTTLKLNLGGVSGDLQLLRERLELESGEVLRLRETVDALQADKIAMARAAAKMNDETLPLAKVEAERAAFEDKISVAKQRYQEEKARLQQELKQLSDFKAEFENLAERSLNESESDGRDSGGVSLVGEREEKWKMRVKKLQKYLKWQLAEAEAQTRRDRAEMALKVRSHEILMGEMAVLAKGYRHERARLYQANRNLLQQLADIEAQQQLHQHRRIARPLSPTTHSPSSPIDTGGDRERDRADAIKHDQSATCKARERAGGAGRHWGDAKPSYVPVHTLERAPDFVAVTVRKRLPFARAATSSAPLATAAAAGMGKDAISLRRPRTSTGCQRRAESKKNPLSFGDRHWRAARENASMKQGVDTLARQLRSRVRDEFLGPPARLEGARERVKDISAATARYTRRDPMVLSKPLSAITGSILTNVPLLVGDCENRV